MAGRSRVMCLNAAQGLPRLKGVWLLACVLAVALVAGRPVGRAFADQQSASSNIAIEVAVHPAAETGATTQDGQSLPRATSGSSVQPKHDALASTGERAWWVVLAMAAAGGIGACGARCCERRRGSAHARR